MLVLNAKETVCLALEKEHVLDARLATIWPKTQQVPQEFVNSVIALVRHVHNSQLNAHHVQINTN